MQQLELEQLLASIKTQVELLDSNIEQYTKKYKDLTPLIKEASAIKKELGRYKRERREIKSHMAFWIDQFKKQTNGEFPDGMFPLFADTKQLKEAA